MARAFQKCFIKESFVFGLFLFSVFGGMAKAHATESQPASLSTSGYVALTSNYLGRGLAQSVGEPAVQAEININNGDGLYAGVFVSSINWVDQLYPGSSVSIELDGWLGYRKTFAADWTFKGGVMRLQYPGYYAPLDPPAARPDTTELFAAIAWQHISAKLNYAITDAFGTPDSRGTWYLDVSGSMPLGERWNAGVHIGRKQGRGTQAQSGFRNERSSYTDYKVSLTRYFADAFSVDLAWSRTNAEAALYTLNGYNVAGNHFGLTLQKDF